MREKRPPRLRFPRFRGAGDKRSGLTSKLTDEQLLILGLLLVVLLAISMLYCLGFASLAIRDNWQRAPLPWNGSTPAEELLENLPLVMPQDGTASP